MVEITNGYLAIKSATLAVLPLSEFHEEARRIASLLGALKVRGLNLTGP